jgi:hypothetical protein
MKAIDKAREALKMKVGTAANTMKETVTNTSKRS